VINRAVSIASLPITQLNSTKSTLTSEQTALSNLSNVFTSLQTAVNGVDTAAGAASYAVSYSDSSIASATATSGALLGTYNLEVVSVGSMARAASSATVSNPSSESISSSNSFTLTANGQTYSNIMPPPNSHTLTSLVSAINTATHGAVQATIVNVGTPSQPSYQLSIQNTSYGNLPITLNDGNGNLLGMTTPASSVKYRINGQPAEPADPLPSDTRTLNIAPNLSVNVLKAGTTDITVGQSTTNLANAINGLVSAYNSVSAALAGQRGTSGGPLSGHSVVSTLTQSLHNLTAFRGSGSIQSMAEIGLKFDRNGVLSFDSSVLSAAASKDFQGVSNFLGSAKTGGFLQTATDTLKGVLDSSTGAITVGLKEIAGEISYTDKEIMRNQDRVDQLERNLTAQITAADALIASLQQQYSYLNSLLDVTTANQNSR
jgi:flagellar hook-associated protein 2